MVRRLITITSLRVAFVSGTGPLLLDPLGCPQSGRICGGASGKSAGIFVLPRLTFLSVFLFCISYFHLKHI